MSFDVSILGFASKRKAVTFKNGKFISQILIAMEETTNKLFDLLSKSGTTPQQLQKFLDSNSAVDVDLHKNAIVEYTNDKKETPLLYVLKNGREDLAIVLLDAGADPNTSDKSMYLFIVDHLTS